MFKMITLLADMRPFYMELQTLHGFFISMTFTKTTMVQWEFLYLFLASTDMNLIAVWQFIKQNLT